jgi:quercetin dioxygenase-like cupin family protein
VSGFTKLNLRSDVEDQAPKFGFAPNMEYRPARGLLATRESAISFLRLAPGYRMPFGHSHEREEEVYVLLAGGARLKLDDTLVELVPWDAVRIDSDVVRNLEAGPDGAELLLLGAPNAGANDAQMLQDWWT